MAIMIINIDEHGNVTLIDADNFRQLKVSMPSSVEAGVLSSNLYAMSKYDGEYLWLRREWLESHRRSDAEWHKSFSDMLAYADLKGWLGSDGAIRAHIEYV